MWGWTNGNKRWHAWNECRGEGPRFSLWFFPNGAIICTCSIGSAKRLLVLNALGIQQNKTVRMKNPSLHSSYSLETHYSF